MEFGVLVDVCLGVLSVMILFTLSAAAINEMIADNILNMRGKSLHAAVSGLIRKYLRVSKVSEEKLREEVDGVVKGFYTDPAIQSLMETRSWPKWIFAARLASVPGDFRPPSAIEPSVFAKAIEAALGSYAAAAKAAVGSFEDDFTLTMDRVSGWYVRKVKTSLFVIGLVLAIGANLDLLDYARKMADDANLKTRIDATVGMINALEAKDGTSRGGTPPADLAAVTEGLAKTIDSLNGDLEKAGLTVGWACEKERDGHFSLPYICTEGTANYLRLPNGPQLLGWLIIAFGVTLGSQFWFDLFRSLVNLRTPGKTGGTVEQLSASNAPRGGSQEPPAAGAAAAGG